MFAILNADITTVNVALITLGKDLHADLEDLQWGLNSYMLAFAALIVVAGRLADVFRRRRCLLAGAILFVLASLLCEIAPTLLVLVAGRVLQGPVEQSCFRRAWLSSPACTAEKSVRSPSGLLWARQASLNRSGRCWVALERPPLGTLIFDRSARYGCAFS